MLGHVSGRFRGRRFCHLRQTYFVTSHLKAPHWGTLQTSSISRLPRRSREPGSPTAELLQAGSSLQSRRDQATRPPRAPYAVSGHLLARTAHFRGGSRKQPAAAVADQARAAVRHGLVAVTAPGIARAASLWWSGRFVLASPRAGLVSYAARSGSSSSQLPAYSAQSRPHG